MVVSSSVPNSHIDILTLASKQALDAHQNLFVVGGAIRDSLLGKSSLDYDLVIEGDGVAFAKELHKKVGGTLKEFPNFLTAKISNIVPGLKELDVASAREETYESPGSLPKVTSSTIAKDLSRRDFTINTLVAPLNAFIDWAKGEGSEVQLRKIIIDNFSGLADLENRIIRVLHPKSFFDDPTRIFRGCRYVARINGALDPETRQLMTEAILGGALEAVSKYRILNEFKWILLEENRLTALKDLCQLKIFTALSLCNDTEEDSKVFTLLQSVFSKESILQIPELDPKSETAPDLYATLLFSVLTKDLDPKEKALICKEWRLSKERISKADQTINNLLAK